MAAEALKNEENTRRLKYSELTDGEDEKKDNDDEDDRIKWTLWICLKSARNSRGSQQEVSHL